MTARPDVVVVGGGIAGLTISLALASRGRRLVIIDEARPGSASTASAGMLAPRLGMAPAIRERAVAARDHYVHFLAALRDETGVEVTLDRRGIIELAGAEPGALDALHRRATPGVRRLDPDALHELEPLLHSGQGGVLHAGDGAVDVAALMHALATAVERSANIRRVDGAVATLDETEHAATVTTADGMRHRAPRVVLAGGAWVALLGGLPRPLPVRPVHGELLRVAAAGPHHVIYGPDGYLITRGETVLVGATSSEAGFRATPSDAGRTSLLAGAARMLPALAGAPVVAHWAGLRPVTPDGLPILGPDPDRPALVYACGGSRNGILFAPWAAERIVEAMDGVASDALAPFGIGRLADGGQKKPPG